MWEVGGIASQHKRSEVKRTTYFLTHFGTVFGLTEEAAAIILTEMGLLTYYYEAKSTYLIRRMGWDDLPSMFQIDELLGLKTATLSGTNCQYVWLGIVPKHALSPLMIWNKYKTVKNSIVMSRAIGDRQTTSFVTQ
jgi:hypothetical protein